MSISKNSHPDIILFDLPTFPKGVLALSLINVATSLSRCFELRIIDLNFYDPLSYVNKFDFRKITMVGLKVSSQNFLYAKEITAIIKSKRYQGAIVWGGELPTLLPDKCLEYADCIVSGLFEPIAGEFISDLQNQRLKKQYQGHNNSELTIIPPPRFDLIENISGYYKFMGLPFETSRGCTETCAFCMVHTMQKKNYHLRNPNDLNEIAFNYRGHFVNIIDYNFGVNKRHVTDTSLLLKNNNVSGWMAEMCIEELDDDEMLSVMRKSGCRIIYCGLESIDEKALASVHKMNTNHVERYEKIIRKVQSHGIQIAAGIIIGIDNMNEETFETLNRFFTKMGIVYAKLTFLTYNPGAKVQRYMTKKGKFCTEDVTYFDGNHLTYIPDGLDEKSLLKGLEKFIHSFYSITGIIKRSNNNSLSILDKLEFILFNLCYRDAYIQWLDQQTFYHPKNFETVLHKPFRKSRSIRFYEQILSLCRKLNR